MHSYGLAFYAPPVYTGYITDAAAWQLRLDGLPPVRAAAEVGRGKPAVVWRESNENPFNCF